MRGSARPCGCTVRPTAATEPAGAQHSEGSERDTAHNARTAKPRPGSRPGDSPQSHGGAVVLSTVGSLYCATHHDRPGIQDRTPRYCDCTAQEVLQRPGREACKEHGGAHQKGRAAVACGCPVVRSSSQRWCLSSPAPSPLRAEESAAVRRSEPATTWRSDASGEEAIVPLSLRSLLLSVCMELEHYDRSAAQDGCWLSAQEQQHRWRGARAKSAGSRNEAHTLRDTQTRKRNDMRTELSAQ